MDDLIFHSIMLFLCMLVLLVIWHHGDVPQKDIDIALSQEYTCYLDLVEVDIHTIDLSDKYSYNVTFNHDDKIVLVTSRDRHDVVSYRDISLGGFE